MSEARARLRDMIAAKVRAEYDKLPPGRYPTERAVADAVMELFAYVKPDAEWLAPGYAVVWLDDPTTKEN